MLVNFQIIFVSPVIKICFNQTKIVLFVIITISLDILYQSFLHLNCKKQLNLGRPQFFLMFSPLQPKLWLKKNFSSDSYLLFFCFYWFCGPNGTYCKNKSQPLISALVVKGNINYYFLPGYKWRVTAFPPHSHPLSSSVLVYHLS